MSEGRTIAPAYLRVRAGTEDPPRAGEAGTLLVGLIANLVFTVYYAFFVVPAGAELART